MKPIFLCDFDGTISLKDVTDVLLEHFGEEGVEALEDAWVAGEIGSKECMAGQVALLNMSEEELNECLANIAIDQGFKEFLQLMKAQNIPVQIVSDGLDYAISTILANHDITDVPILANHLVNKGERSWALEFPYTNELCKKKSGNCKCTQTELLYQDYDQIFYVGDGTSDFCVSHQVDLIYAKDKLIEYCDSNKLNYISIQGFSDIVAQLE